ncbi:MAG TPA: ABC transporter permease [Vicinamibacteria bacterium]
MPYELAIALRYLTARRKQVFISVISGISVLGVTVGVMALMVALGLMTGLQREIRSKILGATAHVSVFKSGGEPFEEWSQVAAAVRTVPGVEGSAPAVYGKALVSSTVGSAVATLKGVLPEAERTVTDIGGQVHGASLEVLAGGAEGAMSPVLLGHELASNLAVGRGDVISVTSAQGRLSPLGMLPRVTKFRVAGTVRTGLYEFDAGWGYLPLAAAQRLFGAEGQVSLVEVRVEDIYAVQGHAREILRTLGDGYLTNDWIQMNQSLFSALWLEKVAIGLTIGLIVLVAALNIMATLILMVMEKHKDVGILVSMGASRGAVMRIFMLQGLVIGTVGTLVGSLLGWTACRVLDRYKLIQIPVDVYQISHVPFTLLPRDAAVVVAGAMLVCFLTTILPALGAAKLAPAEALRYE